jgi:cysteinyl-tRNA synthetase
MCLATLGETLDLHMGGIEHISIHHTNEIAQSEAYTGKKFVNYWLHNEHLNMDGKKIGKSTGNFYLVEDLINLGYSALHLRYFFLQAHYRSKQNFTLEALDASKVAFEKLINYYQENKTNSGKIIDEYKKLLLKNIADDFNIPAVLANLWILLKSDYNKEDIIATIDFYDQILGLNLVNQINNQSEQKYNSPEIKSLLLKREQARRNKDWKLADQIRDQLKKNFNLDVQDKQI